MYKKVYYVVKSTLHVYPPCLAQIRMLKDIGVDVVAVYGSSKSTAIDLLRNDGIECIELIDARGKFKGKVDKIYNWLTFRRSFVKFLRTIDKEHSLLWFGNVESYLPLFGVLYKCHTAVSFLELLDLRSFKSWFVGLIVKKNIFLTACEETRAYIMKDNWGLNELPTVLPNKPYRIDILKNALPSVPETKLIIEELGNAKFVVYQGIFQKTDYIKAVALALKEICPDYYFVLMGMDINNVMPQIKELNPNVVYVPYIPAPLHLEITSHARIGVVFYEPYFLNHAFCAPNKIYEYSSYGIPIIGNDIPGLKNTIGAAHAGICIDMTKESVISAIQYIENHYAEMQECAYDFYKSTDNLITTKQIVMKNGIEIITPKN